MTARNRDLTHTLTIRLPEPVLGRLRARAAKQSRKISDYVRLLIDADDQPDVSKLTTATAILTELENMKARQPWTSGSLKR